MRLLALVAVSVATAIPAQDFIFYKFDATCAGNSEVINFATGAQAFPENGVLEENTGAPWTSGVYGGALAAGDVPGQQYNRVISGWDPAAQPMTGDITIAYYVREASAYGTSLPYLLGGTSGFRLFTNGIAGTGLVQRNIAVSGGSPTGVDCELPGAVFDFQAAAAAGWVHIALVIDSMAGTADWYVDGMPTYQQVGIGGGQINSPGPFKVGYNGTGSESAFDMDEFLLANRAYTPNEVLVLALTSHPGEGDYDSNIPSQCGAGNVTVGSSGGAPAIGNANYAIQVSTTVPSLFFLLAGLDRCLFGGVTPLPLDGTPLLPELAGCYIVADAITLIGGATSGTPVDLPLPIPGAAGNLGLTLYFQALAFDLTNFDTSMSNGWAVGIGQ